MYSGTDSKITTLDELTQSLDKVIQEYKEESPTFPFMSCEGVAHRLREEFGFLWVKGKYTGSLSEEYLQKARKVWTLPTQVQEVAHDFSYAPELGLFIDLTATQFDKSLPRILLLKNTDQRIALNYSERNSNTTHYIRGIYNLAKHGATSLNLDPDKGLSVRRIY